MGLEDLKLFSMEQTSVTKIQGRTNTRRNSSTVDAGAKEDLEFFVFFKVCDPLAQATRRSQSKELKFFTKAKTGLQLNQSRPGLAWEGLDQQYHQVCPPQPPPPPQVLGLRSNTKTFKKIRKLIKTKIVSLDGPLTLAQKRQRLRNILRQKRQRRPATTMGQKPAQENSMLMLPMSSYKVLILMKPNNKGTKNLTCGTAPAKVAVTRRQRQDEKTIVPSQPRSLTSLTRRWRSVSRIIRAPLAMRVANPL